MKRRFEDCSCTCGCGFCKGWPRATIQYFSPHGRPIMTKEQRELMDFPYPPEPDL